MCDTLLLQLMELKLRAEHKDKAAALEAALAEREGAALKERQAEQTERTEREAQLRAALADAETSSFTLTSTDCGLHLHTPATAVNVTVPS